MLRRSQWRFSGVSRRFKAFSRRFEIFYEEGSADFTGFERAFMEVSGLFQWDFLSFLDDSGGFRRLQLQESLSKVPRGLKKVSDKF